MRDAGPVTASLQSRDHYMPRQGANGLNLTFNLVLQCRDSVRQTRHSRRTRSSGSAGAETRLETMPPQEHCLLLNGQECAHRRRFMVFHPVLVRGTDRISGDQCQVGKSTTPWFLMNLQWVKTGTSRQQQAHAGKHHIQTLPWLVSCCSPCCSIGNQRRSKFCPRPANQNRH